MRATGPMAHFNNSAGIPSGPGARPFLSFLMAAIISRDGLSTVVPVSEGVVSASSSSVVECVPGGWFSAASKSSLHRSNFVL